MAWTSPRTWVTGEIVTAAMMNEQIRDNLLYLGDPPLNIDAGLLYTDTTNDRVGIGTTTPETKVDVSGPGHPDLGTLRITGGIRWLGLTTRNDNYRYVLGDDPSERFEISIYDKTAASWAWSVVEIYPDTPPSTLVLTSTGVGIGTTPASELHIEANSGDVELRLRAPGNGTNTAYINFYDSTDDKYWHFVRRDGAYASEPNWFGFYFWDGSSWTTAMRLRPDGDVVFSNDVGIGVADPQNKLHVRGNAIRLERTGAEPFFFFYRPEAVTGYTGGLEFAGLDSENTWTGYSQIRHYVQDATAGNEGAALVFRTRRAGAFQTDLVVGSWGRVGVRCWPEFDFDIFGTTQLRRVADADATNTLRDSNILQFQGAYWDGAANVKVTGSIFLDVTSATPEYGLALQTAGVTRLFIDETGYVGIGTITPGRLLEICNGDLLVLRDDGSLPEILLANDYSPAPASYYIAQITSKGRNSDGDSVEACKFRTGFEDNEAGAERTFFEFRGLWNGVENQSFVFYNDGRAYADVGWYTFSPSIPDDASPKQYLEIALEEALKPKKPFHGFDVSPEELEKYEKDISKIAIAIARYCESVEERLQRIEKHLGII